MKKAVIIIKVTILSIIEVLLIGVLVLVLSSPGKLGKLKDAEGNVIAASLTEKTFEEIGGVRQGFFLRSENPDNPVILLLHGGPGSPELALLYKYEIAERLEKYFTVCYWDQRGAGMSYSSSIDPSTMTLDQMVEDTLQITEYLKLRFDKEKIYLVGHSWGSFLGIKTIEKYPEHYAAFIGIGQVTNQVESEKLAYDYMLQHAMEINDKAAVKNLQKYDRDADDFPSLDYISKVRSSLMNKYGIGIMHSDFSMAGLIKDILLFKGYTISEKISFIRGMVFSQTHLWDCVVNSNLFESSVSFKVPVYITQGIYDYQVSYTLAHEYFEIIKAPDKEFFTFEESAHSPNGEEPEKFVQIIHDIAQKFEKE